MREDIASSTDKLNNLDISCNLNNILMSLAWFVSVLKLLVFWLFLRSKCSRCRNWGWRYWRGAEAARTEFCWGTDSNILRGWCCSSRNTGNCRCTEWLSFKPSSHTPCKEGPEGKTCCGVYGCLVKRCQSWSCAVIANCS